MNTKSIYKVLATVPCDTKSQSTTLTNFLDPTPIHRSFYGSVIAFNIDNHWLESESMIYRPIVFIVDFHDNGFTFTLTASHRHAEGTESTLFVLWSPLQFSEAMKTWYRTFTDKYI